MNASSGAHQGAAGTTDPHDVLPECLLPYEPAWLVWRPKERNSEHLFFASGWCATRCRDVTDRELAAGAERTVMRGTPEALAAALDDQARTANLIR